MNDKGKWISGRKVLGILVILGIISLCIYIFFFYHYIGESSFKDKDKAIEFVKEKTDIQYITGAYFFSGETSYEIMYGADKSQEEFILFNPAGNRNADELITLPVNDLYSREVIEDEWQTKCDGCTLKKSGPAMIKDEALWELTYMDQSNGYVMEYISLKDGTTFEKLRLHQKYNKKG